MHLNTFKYCLKGHFSHSEFRVKNVISYIDFFYKLLNALQRFLLKFRLRRDFYHNIVYLLKCMSMYCTVYSLNTWSGLILHESLH